ncbi:uncharacterized protein LOC135389095 [Ornithodoros turicata]|uniref:uncharacterized protein LOC135389095 n=1 Tax=Ornithodoros turicata TaxID=34597 RepID=UPI003138AB99
MTRWARSKNPLKHTRQPEEATSWTEFHAQRQREDSQGLSKAVSLSAQGQRGIYRTRCHRIPAGDLKAVETGDAANMKGSVETEGGDCAQECKGVENEKKEIHEDTIFQYAGGETEWKPEQEKHSHVSDSKAISSRNLSGNRRKGTSGIKRGPQSDVAEAPANKVKRDKITVSKNGGVKSERVKCTRRNKLKRNLKKDVIRPASGWTVTEIREMPLKVKQTEKNLKEGEESVAEQKRRVCAKENEKRKQNKCIKEDEYGTCDSTDEFAEKRDHETNSTVGGAAKKKKFMDQLRKERERKGIILLPEKVEKRIYAMKKAMRQKGISGEEIKTAVRKVRRKEELLFRRQLEKRCFKCRQPGHKVSDCPMMEEEIDEAVGICFKCGSTEHFSSKCHVETSLENEFPYAKCFICKQGGHLSRKCPRNDKGVYPKGGHCNFCGAIDHFKKDCPQMERNKKKDEEPEITGDMMDIHGSADAEPVTPDMFTKQRKSKIVTF